MIELIPAILTDRARDLARQLAAVASFAATVHVDIMDGVFVPHVSIAIADLARNDAGLNVELHLMVQHPEALLAAVASYHPLRVLVHPETLAHPYLFLQRITADGIETGIAVMQTTPNEALEPLLADVGSVTFVTVTPGAQGGELLPDMLNRAATFRAMHPGVTVEIDGGVHEKTAARILMTTGAQRLVVGSALWESTDPATAYHALLATIEKTRYD